MPEKRTPPLLLDIVTEPPIVLPTAVTPAVFPLRVTDDESLLPAQPLPDGAPSWTRPDDELTLMEPLTLELQIVNAVAPVAVTEPERDPPLTYSDAPLRTVIEPLTLPPWMQ